MAVARKNPPSISQITLLEKVFTYRAMFLWLSFETWIAQCEDERLLDEQRQEQPCRKAHDK
jgi:hypothetical protein